MIKMKSILSEAYAWEREAGKALPTMKSVQEKYEKNLKEQGPETTDPVLGDSGKQVNVDPVHPEVYDINGGLLPEVPADLNQNLRTQDYREVTVTPKYYFQTKNMGETSYARYDVSTGQLTDNSTGEELVKLNPGLPARQVYLWLRRNHMGKRDNRFQKENVNEAYDSHNMSALIELYHQYKDGGMSKEIFYQLLKILNPDEREELMGYIKTRRDSENYKLPNESPMDYSEDFMEEAYDAKGVEEAKDKKPAKKSDKKSKGKRWQDNDGDGKWYEKGDDVSESDESALNMTSLEESKFWGRVKGNFKGHEYILREAFRK